MKARARERLEEARAALRAGDAAAARRALEPARAESPSGDVVEALARAAYLELDFARAIEDWEQAYALHREAGDQVGAVRVARTLGYMYGSVVGDRAVMNGWIARAQTLLAGDVDSPEAGWVSLNLGMFQGDRDRKEEHFHQALAAARRVGDADLEFVTLAYLGASLVHGDRTEEGMVLLDEALAAVAGSEVDNFSVLEEIFCQLFSACEYYDAIVVGARCAGSPTAMLLARKGYRVLLVDRASFPSDTLSTHLIHAPGVAALRRWGLLDEMVATGCPPIETYSFDFGPFTIKGTPRPHDGIATAYAPRRTVLDKLLVDAADRAGVEVRERFTVEDILVEDGVVVGIRGHDEGGETVTERARVVIGADGRNSRVAKAVRPEQYNEKPVLQWSYYTCWSGLASAGMETVIRPDRGWATLPTNDGLTLLVMGWPAAESHAYKADVEGNYLKTLELAPEIADRVRAATRVERFYAGGVPNFFRKPFGPGWALVGDAGYNKDPITAQGISDAFRDAELCSTALDETFNGRLSFDDAMSAYHQARDGEAMPIYEFTTQLATLEPPPPEMQQLLGAVHGNTDAMDAFVSVVAGTVSPVDFFDPSHIGRIMSAAPQAPTEAVA